MKEKKENISPLDSESKLNLSEYLNKISTIENSIHKMKKHLNFLSKQQVIEEKKINIIYNNSLQVANNKVNNVSSHLFKKQIKGSKMRQCQTKKGLVRILREKSMNDLKKTRNQIFQMKEKQSKDIREFSRKNDEKIKCLKQREKKINLQKVDKVKREEKQKKQRLILQKYQRQKQLQEKILKKNQILEKKQNDMKQTLQKLLIEQEQIKRRLEDKKQVQKKIKSATREIVKMEDQQVVNIAQKFKNDHKLPNISRNLENYELDQKDILKRVLAEQKSLIL